MGEAFLSTDNRFLFTCDGQDNDTFRVRHIKGNDTISSPYCFLITLTSANADIDYDSVINRPATLFLNRKNEYYPYSGIVTSFKYIDSNFDFSTYHVVLQPRLWHLNFNVQSRIFQKNNVPDIIKQVFKDAGMEMYYSLDVQSYPEREYVTQYQESDLAFISRLMEESGIWYFFSESPVAAKSVFSAITYEKMIITDSISNFRNVKNESTFKYRPKSGLVNQIDNEEKECFTHIEVERKMIPEQVTVKNINYRTPETDLSLCKLIPKGDSGTHYWFGGSFKDTGSSEKEANLLIRRFCSQKVIVSGSGDCPGIRAGTQFTLEEHMRQDMNTSFTVTSIAHIGADPEDRQHDNKQLYRNDVTCIPTAAAGGFAPECRTPVPKIPGIMTAKVEAEDGDYAALDNKGRYKVRMPFDRSGTANTKASKYMRLAQPYSGADYGIHFPSHEGTEMIIGHINGDPNKPLGLGTVPNGNTISPVRDLNKTQSVIRTAGGNEMIFDDNDGKQKITIATKKKYRAAFDDENKQIELQTADGNILVLDDGNEKVEVIAGDNKISMSYGSSNKGIEITSVDGNRVSLSDAGKFITIRTNGGNEIAMNDNGKSITLVDSRGKNAVTLDGNKGMAIESSGEISIKAEKDLIIQAENITMTSTKKTVCKATDQLTLKCGTADAVLKKNGDTQIKGNKISIQAHGDLRLKGSQIAAN